MEGAPGTAKSGRLQAEVTGRKQLQCLFSLQFLFFLSNLNELQGKKCFTGLSLLLNIWDTCWKVRSKLLQRSDCWNAGVGYQWMSNNDPRKRIESSKMIHEGSWHFKHSWKERGSSTSPKNLQTNNWAVSSFPSLRKCKWNVGLSTAVWGCSRHNLP